MTDIKILTYNCQGLGNSQKRIDVINILKSKNCDIYCIQDVHCTKATENFIRAQWGYECIFSSKSSNSRGVGILFNKNVDYKIHDYISDNEGNYIIADITVNNNRLTLITLYGPNTASPSFFESLINKSHQFNNNTTILCGDYNCVQDTHSVRLL